MIETNPFLGPQWKTLATAIEILLEDLKKSGRFSIQTYAAKYGVSEETSPYLQALVEDGLIQMEVSANLQVRPKLSKRKHQKMAFYGWLLPDSKKDKTLDFAERNPNFCRYFSVDTPNDEIAEFILLTLVSIYGITEDDMWSLGSESQNSKIYNKGLMDLVKLEDRPDNGLIFGLPGYRSDIVEVRKFYR